MENTTDILDDLVNLDFNEDEQNILDEKFKPQTQVDINEPFYKGSKIGTYIVQSLSVILGFGICIHMTEKFPDIKEFIFIGCLSLLVLWELAKRKVLKEFERIRIINKYKKVKLKRTPYLFGSIVFVGGSMVIGFFGAEHVIQKYSSHQPLQVISQIKESFESQIEEVKEEFGAASLNAFAMANRLHNESNWKGTTSKDVRNEKATLIVLGAKTDSLKLDAVQELESDMNETIFEAEKENKEVLQDHLSWCSSFGWYASLLNVLCDIILFFLLRWCFNHEDSKRKLNKKKKELQEQEPKKKQPKKKIKNDFQEQEQEYSEQEEGSWTTKNGKKAILVRMTKGKNKGNLVAKTKEDIKTNLSSQSNKKSERTKYFQELLSKFN